VTVADLVCREPGCGAPLLVTGETPAGTLCAEGHMNDGVKRSPNGKTTHGPPTPAAAKEGIGPPPPRVAVMSAAALMRQTFPEPRSAVPGVAPEGASVLAGGSKLGKSWIVLGLSIAIAAGGYALGKIRVEQGDVLYLALEDGPRRVQKRLRAILGDEPAPERLAIATTWPRLDDGGLEALEDWLREHPHARFVVIDTFKRVRPREAHNRRLYDLDYEAVQLVQQLALKYHVAIWIVHHTRKHDAEDPLDLISGSTGFTAGLDGAYVLRRARGAADAELVGVHRDLTEDLALALRWDAQTRSWTLLGEAAEQRRSKARQEVLDALAAAGEPLAPKMLAEVLGKKDGTVRKLMWEMTRDGELAVGDDGRYAPKPANSGNGGNAVTQDRTQSQNGPATALPDARGAGNAPRGPHRDQKAGTVTALPPLPLIPTDADRNRGALLEMAEARLGRHDYPELALSGGRTVLAGADTWGRFLRHATAVDLAEVVNRLAEEYLEADPGEEVAF
jgi:hypothetical protein